MRVFSVMALTVGLLWTASVGEPLAAQARPTAPPELLERPYLYDVVRYLYRWYLDEGDLDRLVHSREFVFWVRGLQPELDEDDRSRFGEIALPRLGIRVRVKLADYTITELETVVKSDMFKIVAVSRDLTEERPPESTAVTVDYGEMRDELYRTRREARFPEGELLERLRRATRHELLKDSKRKAREAPAGLQVVHLAPLSPVANEAWVFWESGRMLIRFASDIDLANPTVWEHEELAVRTYDVDQQVVVSLDEVAGSNAFLTRDQVGRILYNCIVLGQRMELQPQAGQAIHQPAPRRSEGGDP